jgi:pilus assembly protein CpaF
MALMSDVDLPLAHVREQVSSAIDVVVQMTRLRDGRRVVSSIATVDGVLDGDPCVTEVFAYRGRHGRHGTGRFVSTGAVPSLRRVLLERGEDVPASLFCAREPAEAGPGMVAP